MSSMRKVWTSPAPTVPRSARFTTCTSATAAGSVEVEVMEAVLLMRLGSGQLGLRVVTVMLLVMLPEAVTVAVSVTCGVKLLTARGAASV